MEQLHTQSKEKLKINDFVTHDGESCVIVDVEPGFYWIRNTMNPNRTEKVRREDVSEGGAYGDTVVQKPQLSTVVANRVDNLTVQQRARVEEITEEIAGKTIREVRSLELPSA